MSEPIKGTIEMENGAKMDFELYPDIAPKSAANFVKLAESGFYNGLTFHRIVPALSSRGATPTATVPAGPGGRFLESLPPTASATISSTPGACCPGPGPRIPTPPGASSSSWWTTPPIWTGNMPPLAV